MPQDKAHQPRTEAERTTEDTRTIGKRLTISEAAEMIAYNPRELCKLITRKHSRNLRARLYARKVGPVWTVDSDQIIEWVKTRKRGRPKRAD